MCPNMRKWGWCRQGTILWFACQSILQESRTLLTQKSFWYHFSFQRYEKNKFDMLEFSEYTNSCFKQLKVPFCKQVNEASKQCSMETSFSNHFFTPLRYLEEHVPKVIWSHYQEFDKFWPCCTSVHLIQNGFCRHPPHMLHQGIMKIRRKIFYSNLPQEANRCTLHVGGGWGTNQKLHKNRDWNTPKFERTRLG